MTEDAIAQLLSRVETLERKGRWFRREAWVWRLGTVVACAAAAFALWLREHPAPLPPKLHCEELHARDIALVDEKGMDRARLYINSGGHTVLTMQVGNGKNRVTLAATEVGGGLLLHDQRQASRVVVGVTPDGPTLDILSPDNQMQARVASDVTGGVVLIAGQSGNHRVKLGVNPDGAAGLELFDAPGRGRASFVVGPTNRPQLTLRDEVNKQGLHLGWFESNDGPMLVALDANGVIRGVFGLVRDDGKTNKLLPILRFNNEKGDPIYGKP